MKKFFVILGLLLSLSLFSQETPLPNMDITEIKESNYTIRVEYIAQYKQAVFIFITDENLFDEGKTEIILDEEIIKFEQAKGFYGYKGIQYEYRIRYRDNKVYYTKPVRFIYSSY